MHSVPLGYIAIDLHMQRGAEGEGQSREVWRVVKETLSLEVG